MIAAGEASGDQHAAAVARKLTDLRPDARIFGMGSGQLRRCGMEILVDSAPLAVVGLVEVLAHYPALRRALKLLQRTLSDRRPDLLLLVDNPEFNLKLAKTAQELGIPVLYYISPQIWAWRQGRVKKIGRLVDHMAVVFPFEESFYRNAGIDVSFVGHPLLDELPDSTSPSDRRVKARHQLGLSETSEIVGLFPGSRKSEIRRLLPLLAEAAQALAARRPNTRFILPVAATLDADAVRACLDSYSVAIEPITGADIYDVINACDAIAASSGTVTLQIALMGIPLTIVYRVSPISYRIGKRLIKIPHIGLPNIVAQDSIVRELIQDQATADSVSAELERLLCDQAYTARLKDRLSQLKARLGQGGASLRVAELAAKMLPAGR